MRNPKILGCRVSGTGVRLENSGVSGAGSGVSLENSDVSGSGVNVWFKLT